MRKYWLGYQLDMADIQMVIFILWSFQQAVKKRKN